tara:strand:+ start:2884 stop:4389 length:1506 start_codon:yes stop_codon:yes gene_type:complete
MNYFLNTLKNNPLLKFYIFVGLILHFISIYFSVGFYKDDEHFQILEPVAYWLGLNDILIEGSGGQYWEWELHHKIRPWLQVNIFYYIIILFKHLGIQNPFDWTLLIRFFVSILGYLSIIYMFVSIKKDFFKKDTHFTYLLFFSFWFYPFLHSRTSSENLGITVFTFAFCFLYTRVKKKDFNINILTFLIFSLILGFSLVIRFNLIFTVLPFCLWIFLFRFNFKKILIGIFGILSALGIGLIVDHMSWSNISPGIAFDYTWLNYYDVVITRGWHNSYGVHPWWFFFTQTIIELAPLLSIFFVFSILLYWFKNPISVYTWITLFPVFVLSFIGHKEIRFLFPIYIFAPLFICFLFEKFEKIKFLNFLKGVVIFSNLIFLFITLFTPANIKIDLYKYLFENYNQVESIYYVGNDPLTDNPYLINGMEPFFYTKFLPPIVKFNEENINNKMPNNLLFLTKKYDVFKKIIKKEECKKQYSSFPEKIINLNKNWKNLNYNWYAIYCY